MANLQFHNATFFRRKAVGTVQTAQTIRISVKTDITEVLSVGVENYVNSYEATDGEVTFFGKTSLKLIYNDGTGVLGNSFGADFTASIPSEDISAGTKLCFEIVTVDTKTETNANTATVTVLLEVTAFAYIGETLPVLAQSDDAFLRCEGMEVLSAADVVDLPVIIDEELCATHTITSVLLAESSVLVEQAEVSADVLRIEGEATVKLTYLSEGRPVTDSLPFKFTRELDATALPADAQLHITPHVRATKVRLNIAENSENTCFTAEISATLCTEATTTEALQVATDAYAVNCDFDFCRQTVTTTLPCGKATEQKHIVITLPPDDAKSPIVAVNTGALVTKCTVMEGRAQVEGVIFATAIFDGPSWESSRLELPFIETVSVDFLCSQCTCQARATVINFALSGEGSLTATTDLCLEVFASRDVNCNVITAADEKPFDKSQLPAIEVCLAHKGETLWQLAKSLHMSEQDLTSVNPEISTPLDRDARIVVYNKI